MGLPYRAASRRWRTSFGWCAAALLKEQDVAQLWPSLSALGLFVLAVSALAMARCRTTLD
uniref:hypothetical protein n=1 Tax=uncultured Caulobacter sp. TaxID=158749 RepID=UPI0025E3542C|nr:hypothetical protein [uncultured Caulobacter sp.]